MLSSQNFLETLNKVERWILLERAFAAVHLLMVTWLTALWAVMRLFSFKVKMQKNKRVQRWMQPSVQTAVFCHLLQWKGNCLKWSCVKWSLKQEKRSLTHWFQPHSYTDVRRLGPWEWENSLEGCAAVTVQSTGLGEFLGVPGGSDGKNPPAILKTQVWSLDQEDPLEKGMGTHSSILAWRIPRIGESAGL